jgi:hypothetical protein
VGGGHRRQPEIEQLDVAAARDQDVGRLQIAMNDAGRVSGDETVGDLQGELDDPLRRVARPDRRALDELHHQVVGPDVVELTDMRVIERSHGPRLALEAIR